jgi:hypothetical protein
MKNIYKIGFALSIPLTGIAGLAQAGPLSLDINTYGSHLLEIYQAGASDASGNGGAARVSTGLFYDEDGGFPTISWVFNVGVAGNAQVKIVAEGIDTGEFDEVFLRSGSGSSQSLGYLTSQGFYRGAYFLNQGPGGYTDSEGNILTGLSTSMYDLGFLKSDTYTIEVVVAKGSGNSSWVNEIETSTLTVTAVPLPSAAWLLGPGLAGLMALGRRRLH